MFNQMKLIGFQEIEKEQHTLKILTIWIAQRKSPFIRFFHNFLRSLVIKIIVNAPQLLTKQVDEIGQGRVWSGFDAKKIGLIDEFGGIEKAIESAAALAELDEYRTISLPKQKDPFTEFLEEFTQTKLSDILVNDLDLIKKEDIIAIKELIKSDKIQTRLPYILNLE